MKNASWKLRGALLGLAAPMALAALAGPVTAAQERGGQQLYQDFGCVLCHGISGHRGASGGRPLAPNNHSLDSFRQLVRYPAGTMPAYPPEALDEARLRQVFDYLAGVQAPPEVEELEVLGELGERLGLE